MADWAGSQGFKQNVSASYDWPDLSSGLSHAMIVANAARDHFSVAKRALENRIPVLVEKPVTLTYSDTQTLVQISRQNETLFATAHVFLFARFIDKFSGFVAKSGAVTSIRIRWSDPKAEERYGEKKSFDPSLPIYVDLIPHALSVISMFAPFRSCDYRGAVLERGGSSLAVSLKLGEVFCEIELLRNGD
jgi:predicted dehydrogenase